MALLGSEIACDQQHSDIGNEHGVMIEVVNGDDADTGSKEQVKVFHRHAIQGGA